MGRLRVARGKGPLRAEHERLVKNALWRGGAQVDAEDAETLRIEGTYGELARRAALDTWRARMVHEHRSAAVFSRLLPQLMEAEATIDVKTGVLRMSMDELHHATLCAAIVRALGGEAEADAELATEVLPEHVGCTPRERALRNVMFVGCLSETIAVALLTEERELTTEPLVRRVVTQLVADEVTHAKLGWSYLAETWPELDAAARTRTNDYLRVALGAIESDMKSCMPIGPELDDETRTEMAALGVLEGREGRALLADTIEHVIVPRLVEHGLDAVAAWRDRPRGPKPR